MTAVQQLQLVNACWHNRTGTAAPTGHRNTLENGHTKLKLDVIPTSKLGSLG